MKYFTDELWSKFNSVGEISDAEYKEASRQWTENGKQYMEQFEKAKNYLTTDFLDVYEKSSGFHDYRLVTFNIVHEEYGTKQPISIKICVTDYENTWEILYKGISKFNISYEVEKGSFSELRGLDDWGYDEILEVDGDTLSHEILFASGASILIHFQKSNISILRVTDDLKDT
jgi:hypothetical protein